MVYEGFTKRIEDELLPELEKLGKYGVLRDDYKKKFEFELRDAEMKIKFIEYYIKYHPDFDEKLENDDYILYKT